MWGRQRSWEPGSWAEATGRPRVLLEDPDGAIRSASESFLSREGYDVMACCGPEEMGRRTCPVVAGESCALAEGADVIYTSLCWREPGSREVLRAVRARYPDVPVVVEVSTADEQRYQEDLVGCAVVNVPVGRIGMLTAIRRALAGSTR